MLVFDKNQSFSLSHAPSVTEGETSSAIINPELAEGRIQYSLLIGLMCLVFCPGVAWGYGLAETGRLYV